MKMVLFVGPSLSVDDRRAMAGAHVAHPIRRGDLALYSDYDLLVVVDGEFGQSLSVSPKELLAALDAGKTVIGAASMGALRAAELDSFGMIGVGWVYERFRRAAVRRDDDVALCYSPFDLAPVTVPMVDIEYSLERIAEEGLVTGKERQAIARKSRAIFFADRTPQKVDAVLAEVLGAERSGGLRRLFPPAGPSVKTIDAKKSIELAFSIAAKSGSG